MPLCLQRGGGHHLTSHTPGTLVDESPLQHSEVLYGPCSAQLLTTDRRDAGVGAVWGWSTRTAEVCVSGGESALCFLSSGQSESAMAQRNRAPEWLCQAGAGKPDMVIDHSH